jgi:hypothetical protein
MEPSILVITSIRICIPKRTENISYNWTSDPICTPFASPWCPHFAILTAATPTYSKPMSSLPRRFHRNREVADRKTWIPIGENLVGFSWFLYLNLRLNPPQVTWPPSRPLATSPHRCLRFGLVKVITFGALPCCVSTNGAKGLKGAWEVAHSELHEHWLGATQQWEQQPHTGIYHYFACAETTFDLCFRSF